MFASRRRARGPGLGPALALSAVLATVPMAGPLAAQTAAERAFASCSAGAAGSTALARRCADGVLAAQAFQSGLGFLMTAGGPIPASPSTAGRRLSTQPRVILDAGLGWASFRHPDLGTVPTEGRLRDRRTTAIGPRISGAVGLFEGFAPVPGVGGVLAVDLVAMAQYLRLGESSAFSESAVGWGGGVRVGAVRESFSLPGVTLSAIHLRLGGVSNGVPEASGARVWLRPRATSLRAIVGKDLWTVGLSGGVGWDRYGGAILVEAEVPTGLAPPAPATVTGVGGPVDLKMRRRYLFVGANFTWIVAQAAAELVWADSASPVTVFEGSGPYRPGDRELQGSLSFRVTF